MLKELLMEDGAMDGQASPEAPAEGATDGEASPEAPTTEAAE